MSKWLNPRSAFGIALIAAALIALPFVAAMGGQAWVRILNFAILYVFLALGLNIVVGFAGLLDLGYIASFLRTRGWRHASMGGLRLSMSTT